MNCPDCGIETRGRVLKTVRKDGARIRVIRCVYCHHRFKTRETILDANEGGEGLPVARRLVAGILNLIDIEGLR